MSYVQSINPFDGILCVPYFYLFIAIIFSWILAGIEVVIVELTEKCSKIILRQHHGLENKVNAKLRIKFQTELENLSIFPTEIVSIIMSMLPLQHGNWRKHRASYQKTINAESNSILSIKYLYPLVRFFANCINLIIIIVHYSRWYEENTNFSNWDRYCAFIVSLLYMPIFKGRATMRWFGFPIWYPGPPRFNSDKRETPWIMTSFCHMFCEWSFVAMFMMIAAPILISGAFIYLPTTLLFMLWMTCSFTLVFVCFMDCVSEDVGGYSGMTISSTIGMIFVLTVSTVCTMEFYANGDWVQSYRIGLLGEYCDEEDYFSFGKWSEYRWDMRFLIMSWVVF